MKALSCVLAAVSGCCLLAPGCTGPIYQPGQQYFPDAISPRTQWTATGTVADPVKAIDGNVATAAVAPVGVADPMLVVDLGKPCLLNMIVVDHGANEMGYCRLLAVQTSDDGMHWVERASVPGLRRVTNVLLTSQVLARYVRLKVARPGGGPWSVAEVYIN